jgi:2-keto-4-pentenoate hydratase/2-oxohepta-3-ene-1,7-dioic acid hydratase in catechol pathway
VLALQTTLNGALMQDGTARKMIFPIAEIVSFLSQGTTLPAGTVIITGTPPGIGDGRNPKVWLKNGDEVRCFISHGIGTLVNRIVYE